MIIILGNVEEYDIGSDLFQYKIKVKLNSVISALSIGKPFTTSP